MDFFDVLTNGDLFSLLCITGILTWLGSRMARESPNSLVFGRRVAAFSFVIYSLSQLSTIEADAGQWLSVSIRGLLTSGIMLGIGWMFFSIVFFLVGLIPRSKPKASKVEKSPIVYVEKPVPAPAQQPTLTQEQQYDEAMRRFHKNCEIIEKSPLDATAKNAHMEEERRVLANRIKQVME